VTPDAPTPAEDRVGDLLQHWLAGRYDEPFLFGLLSRQVWEMTGVDSRVRVALAEELHDVLVQLRDAYADWVAGEPEECAATPNVEQAACTAMSQCGAHRAALYRWMDARQIFVAQVLDGCPARARAKGRKMGVGK
jgi:hypothetical protein